MKLEDLDGYDIVVYGTGKFARTYLPYVSGFSGLNICGTTNSKVAAEKSEDFMDFPIRSIQEWKKLEPQAAILVLTAPKHFSEIYKRCKMCGFENVVQIDKDFLGECQEKFFLDYFGKRGIALENEYFSWGKLNLLTHRGCGVIRKVSYFNDLSNFIIPRFDTQWEIVGEGPYDCDDVKLSPGNVVLDCGANIGMFSAYAASKDCTCYAFEPTPELQNVIYRHSELNQNLIIPVQAAVGDTVGTASFHITESPAGNFLSNTIKDREHIKTIQVQQTTIDQFVDDRGLTHVDFIKADIEGSERLMLKGAQATLAKFAPRLSICTYHLPDDKEVLTDLILKANPRYQIDYKWEKLFAHVPR